MIDNGSTIVSQRIGDAAQVRRLLLRRAERVLLGHNGHAASERRVVRLVVPVESIDPFAWLRGHGGMERLYWSSRSGEEVVAAVGQADVCELEAPSSFSACRDALMPRIAACDAGTRYYGGARFDPGQEAAPAWKSFGAYRFVLPRFELRYRDGEATLVCNLALPRDRLERNRALEEIAALRLSMHSEEPVRPGLTSRSDRPGFRAWRDAIREALRSFEGDALAKVVFARETTLHFEGTLDPLALLERLREATPNSFHFCFQPPGHAAFVGATPELLFRWEGAQIMSEAVAGTRPRGRSPEEDTRLLAELLRSDKDRREHAYVRDSIREALAGLCLKLDRDTEPSEMKLASRWHLVSHISGTAKPGVTGLDVLQALHPTPAVGGVPTVDALRTIREREPFDRGWYAGPVGWIGPNGAEFAVGIRSGLVRGAWLSLYSGAGIVPGSVPDLEWEEIEQKISDFLDVLGVDLQRV